MALHKVEHKFRLLCNSSNTRPAIVMYHTNMVTHNGMEEEVFNVVTSRRMDTNFTLFWVIIGSIIVKFF